MTTAADLTSLWNAYQKARTGLLIRFPWYFFWLSQTIYTPTDAIEVAAVAPDLKKHNFKLMLNPALMSRIETTGFMMILAHEVLHILFNHCRNDDWASRHKYWNLAIDMFVNDRLMRDGFKMPKHPDKPDEDFGITLDNMAQRAEEEWAKLGQPRSIVAAYSNQSPEVYLRWCIDNLPEYENLSSDGQNMIDSLNHEAQNQNDLSPVEKQIVQTMAAQRCEQAKTDAGGNLPGTIAGKIEELIKSLKPQISWQKHIKKFVGQLGNLELIPTHARINKYGGTPKIIGKPQKVVWVVVDTSASVPSDMLRQFIGEVEGIAQHCEVVLFWIDHEVYKPIKPFKKCNEYPVKGRGGTDMRLIFTRKISGYRPGESETYTPVDELPRHLRPAGIVILTDLETAFPTHAQRCGVRTLWVGCRNHPVPREAGEVVYLPSAQAS